MGTSTPLSISIKNIVVKSNKYLGYEKAFTSIYFDIDYI
jgi:hypothetical protein